MSTGSDQSWAVVGGGLLGLSLALRLAQAGRRVTVFEAAPEVGGLAAAWQVGELTWDRHYHVTLLSDKYLGSLLAELNLSHELRWVETRTGFYTDDRLHSMSNTVEFLRFPPLRLLDKLRLGATIAYAARVRNWRRLEHVPVADWLRRLSGRRTTEKIWIPLLRAKLGECYKHTSAAFIWATIQRMYAARRTGLKKEMFGYVRGGYARVLARLAERLAEQRVSLRCSAPVSAVDADDQGRPNVYLATGESLAFDRVVVTSPAPVAARLCTAIDSHQRQQLEQIEYLGILCASVVLARPLAGFYVTNITESWVPFTAVIEMTALVDSSELNGRTLVYLPKYAAADDPVWNTTDDQLEERFTAALLRMYPQLCRSDVLAFRVSRARHVAALSTLDYSSRLPAVTTSQPGVFLVGSYQIANGTLNVNETLKLAADALPLLLAGNHHTPCHAEPHVATAG